MFLKFKPIRVVYAYCRIPNKQLKARKGIESLQQTQIFLILYLCNLKVYPLDISNLNFFTNNIYSLKYLWSGTLGCKDSIPLKFCAPFDNRTLIGRILVEISKKTQKELIKQKFKVYSVDILIIRFKSFQLGIVKII